MRVKYLSVIMMLLFAMSISACNKAGNAGVQPPIPEPAPAPVSQEITLYFSDEQAMYLIAEKRLVQVDNASDVQQLASAVINQLIAGPSSNKLTKTIPPESRLLSLKVENALATVNFSKELQTKHWGGSSGELHTLYSIVNSLTELTGIQKVQILIEGEKQESLKGHLDISQPLIRDASLMKK